MAKCTVLVLALILDGTMRALATPRHDSSALTAYEQKIEASCQVDNGVLLDSPSIRTYQGVANPSACCALCTTTPSCVAWTITGLMSAGQQICGLKATIGPQKLTPNATSGIVGNASHFTSHYGNPYPDTWTNASGNACQPDEIEFEMNGVLGSFCSPACTSDGTTTGSCPQDRPPGVTALAQCMLRDPVGSGSHCGLVCTDDADCGSDAHCVTKYSDGVCVYARDRSTELKQELATLSSAIEKNVSDLVRGIPMQNCSVRQTRDYNFEDQWGQCSLIQSDEATKSLEMSGVQCQAGEVLKTIRTVLGPPGQLTWLLAQNSKANCSATCAQNGGFCSYSKLVYSETTLQEAIRDAFGEKSPCANFEEDEDSLGGIPRIVGYSASGKSAECYYSEARTRGTSPVADLFLKSLYPTEALPGASLPCDNAPPSNSRWLCPCVESMCSMHYEYTCCAIGPIHA